MALATESVHARIRYLNPEWRDREERPRICSRESRRATTRFYDVDIEDARQLAKRGELSLDGTGFVLVGHRSEVSDFSDPNEIRSHYYPEIRTLIQGLTGAEHVFVLQHVIRREDADAFNAAYARYVHCDYSEGSAADLSRRLLDEAGLVRNGTDYDYAWYNTWQPIENEARRNPLVLIDSRTSQRDEFVEYLFLESGSEARASMPVYSPKHRHYYFPHMQTSELIAFKQFDTRPDRARACPHTSFDDPTTPEDAPARRSIEVRTLCVFPRS